MRLDPLFDIRDALRSSDATDAAVFEAEAPAHVQRLLGVIDAIDAELSLAEAAYPYDTPLLSVHTIREAIWKAGSPC